MCMLLSGPRDVGILLSGPRDIICVHAVVCSEGRVHSVV